MHRRSTNVRLNNIGVMIFQAAKVGDVEALKMCLHRPEVTAADLSFEDEHRQTPLTAAAIHGHLACVKIIIAYTHVNVLNGLKLGAIAKYATKTVATYLNLCKGDLKRFKTTRAHAEMEVSEIILKPNCSAEDIQRFTTCLDFLVKECGYTLDGSSDDCNWIVRATSSNNIPIVKKLTEDYKASLHVRAPNTLETVLHIACRLKSPLRYYLAARCPALLLELDVNGDLPLHTACRVDDTEFVSWLFQDNSGLAVSTSTPDYTTTSVSTCTPDDKAVSTSTPDYTTTSVSTCTPYDKAVSTYKLDDGTVAPNRTHEDTHSHVANGSCNHCLQSQSVTTSSHVVSKSDGAEVLANGPYGVLLSGPQLPNTHRHRPRLMQKGSIHRYRHLRSHTLPVAPRKALSVGAIPLKRPDYCTTHGKFKSTDILVVQQVKDSHQGDHHEHQGDHHEHQGDHQGDHYEHQQGECQGDHFEHQQGECLGEHQMECQGEHQGECQEEHQEECHRGVQVHPPEPFAFPRNVTDLLSTNNSGHSAVHIAVASGYKTLLVTLLDIISDSARHQSFDASIFISRNSFTTGTPVDLAIINSQKDCLRLLLEFFDSLGLLKSLSSDDKLLKTATFIGDTETVKLLIEFGICAGLEQAISQAIANNFSDIQRLLFFYHTQLTNLQDGVPVTVLPSGHQTGEIRWKAIAMEEVKAEWLVDSYSAIGSVHNTCRELSAGDSSLHRYLGDRCLRHFEDDSPTHLTFQGLHDMCLLVAITSVEISESGLRSVPPELFQMPHLSTLTLAHNSISELPSAFSSSWEVVYTCRSLKKLVLDGNQLSTLPEDLFLGLVCTLEELSVQRNRLTDLPPGLWVMPHLKTLRLSGNLLSRLHYFCYRESSPLGIHGSVSPSVLGAQIRVFYHTICRAAGWDLRGDFNDEAVTCQYQHALRTLSDKLLTELDDEVGGGSEGILGNLSQLLNVDLSFNHFKEIPRELPCVAPVLQRLNMKHNFITNTDLVHELPALITTVNLDNNQIESTTQPQQPTSWVCGSCWMLLYQTTVDGHTPCQHRAHNTLEHLAVLTLGHNRLKDFVIGEGASCPTLLSRGPYTESSRGTTPRYTMLFFPQLSILELPNNMLQAVPKCIHQIDTLNSLDLSFNTSIQTLPHELGMIRQEALSVLKLEGLSLSNIPAHVLHKPSPRNLINYLRTSLLHSKPYRRIKLMLMGSVRAGKTTLLQQLTKRGHVDRRKEVEMGVSGVPLSTVGVDLGDWVYRPQKGSPKVTFMTWDFGGQEEYYATHQCFLSERSLYLVVWDVTEGEKGLEGIKPWLENIEARAPGAPVIVVGTHVDCIKQEEKKYLENMFERLYIKYDSSQLAYPSIEPCCQFVSCFDSVEINHLRDFVYDKAIKYRKPGIGFGRLKTLTTLLDEPVPMSFIKLHNTVRSLAKSCRDSGVIPVYHREEYYNQVDVNSFLGKSEELEEATNFLHESGILLHYEDSQLSDLYFIDPQWLCSMLAKVITIQEKNPYQKNGLMLVQDLDKIFTDSTTKPFIKDLVKIMQKFEVVLLLDEQHLLIPSLLPLTQELSCSVSIKDNSPRGEPHLSTSSPSNIPPVPIPSASSHSNIPSPSSPSSSFPSTLIRYQFLHFIPNGFFSRLIARVISGPILRQCGEWLSWPWPIEEGMSLEGPHWCCWRSGVKLVWNNVEILRIVPVDCPLPGHVENYIISSQGQRKVLLPKAIKIVAGLPAKNHTTSQSTPEQLSAWVLEQGTHCVASMFDDWYEQFGRSRDIELTAATPCQSCKLMVQSTCSEGTVLVEKQVAYFFSSPYCARMVAEGWDLECPLHGKMSVADIAPDLVFRDFVPSMVFDSRCIVKNHTLGEGGFGAVFAGFIREENAIRHVAVKEFIPHGLVERSDLLLAELTAWEIYQNAGQEARVMYRLKHQNILQLLGVTLAPLRLLLELAPLGDLKACVQKFQQAKVKLSRATLQSTMIQVAEALNYLHNQSFIFRDLKPGNVLVWKFPLPETQWTGDQVVQLKLADYGVCQQFTPQGVHGVQGTPPYLPPEVLLHGGQEAYSTKLDVYSFGMFMYYLFSFGNPFEKETRSVAFLLEAGRRPELLPKHHPGSLWMIELMCWCWSEKPQHRPTFLEILRVLRSDTLMKLLSASPIAESKGCVVAACIKLCSGPPHTITGDTCTGDALDHHSNTSAYLEVWCGCDGQLNVVRYSPTGVAMEAIESFDSQVSSICITGDQVWVATVGTGLHVYSATTKKEVARWEGSSKIFKLVFIEHTSCMLALTPTAAHILPLTPTGAHPLVQTLIPQASATLGETIEAGAMVTDHTSWEVWLVSQRRLIILDCADLRTVGSSDHTWKKVGHMETLSLADTPTQVAIADEHYLEKWTVRGREKTQVFNCHDGCKHEYGSHTKLSCITSLLSFNGLMYVGTQGGIILALDAVQLKHLSTLHTCASPSTCLLGVKPALKVRSIARLFSVRRSRDNGTGHAADVTSGGTEWAGKGCVVSAEGPGADSVCVLPLVAERSIVISLGREYRGATSHSENCPLAMNSPGVPTGGSSSGLLSYLKYLNPQPSNVNHLFLWSADSAECSGKTAS